MRQRDSISDVLHDLSHPIADGIGAYPGLPPPRIGPIVDHEGSRDRYEGKATFYLGRVEMSCNTGTYLDAPFHRYPEGQDLSALPLDRMAGLSGLTVEVADEPGPVSLDLEPDEVAGRAVLVRTGRDRLWPEDPYWSNGPFLGEDAVDLLLEGGAALVGVDFANVDDVGDPARPAHTRLLEAGILIVENLRALGPLPRDGYRFSAAPLAVVGGASFPVRAFAET